MSRPRDLLITGEGDRARVVVGGVEIQNGIEGLELLMRAGALPELRVEPLILTTTRVDVEGVEAVVTKSAREVLIALGWTPPAHDEQATTAPR